MTPLKNLIAGDPAPDVATSRQRNQVLCTAIFLGVIGAAIFIISPNIDIAITEALFIGPYHFIFTHSGLAAALGRRR